MNTHLQKHNTKPKCSSRYVSTEKDYVNENPLSTRSKNTYQPDLVQFFQQSD